MSIEASPENRRGDQSGDRERHQQSFWASPTGWVALGFIAVAGYFLITEHAAHLASVLPWLLIAACPLMHVFMHHGSHGGHGHQSSSETTRPED
ncbi:MAG TPA: DUF2933 domain-containing protein [Stellaceae bacterium]|nr:DUF2933 domain-containing protein [Stellaceae bacterium]